MFIELTKSAPHGGGCGNKLLLPVSEITSVEEGAELTQVVLRDGRHFFVEEKLCVLQSRVRDAAAQASSWREFLIGMGRA